MILDTKIDVPIGNNNVKYYTELGYKNLIPGNIYTFPIKDLQIGSGLIINVKCDICEKCKQISYRKYLKNIKSTNVYSCSRICAQFKIENTYMNQYGVKSNLLIKSVRDAQKNTKLLNHGNENYNNTEKTKLTNLEKYGTTSPLINENIKNKTLSTNLKKYGVAYPIQNEEIFNKNQQSGRKIKTHNILNINFQGSYEKDFLDFCVLHHIDVNKIAPIPYKFNNKKNIYFPDFFIKSKNLIIEIKSEYYYSRYLEKNLAKQKTCLEQGYNFLFVINKDYSELLNILSA